MVVPVMTAEILKKVMQDLSMRLGFVGAGWTYGQTVLGGTESNYDPPFTIS